MGDLQGQYIDQGEYDIGGGYGGGYDYSSDYVDYGSISPDYIDYASYDPNAPGSQLTEPSYDTSGGNLFEDYLDYYIELGYDPLTAADFAAQDASEGSITIPTLEQGVIPTSPYDQSYPLNQPQYFPLPVTPYQPPVDYAPYNPVDLTPPTPEPLPQAPAANLPPACPGGQYHPYPIGHPQQNVCVAFPAPPQQQTSTSSSGGSSGGSSAPKAPTPQPQQLPPCPTGQKRDPWTLQCVPQAPAQQACPTGTYREFFTQQCLPIPTQKCATPGTVFDQATGRCVPIAQAVSPLPGTTPSEFDNLFADLSKLPWWLWLALALGGYLILSRDSDGRTTTVRYRRAS